MISKVAVVLAVVGLFAVGLPNSLAHDEDGENHENNSTIQTRLFYGKFIRLPGIARPPTTGTSCATVAACCRRMCPTGQTCPTSMPATMPCTGGTAPNVAPTACYMTVATCPECMTMAQALCTSTAMCTATGPPNLCPFQ